MTLPSAARDAAYLVVVAGLALGVAGTAGSYVVLDFTNDGAVFHDWHVDGLANVEAAARPGQTQHVRFRVDTPGGYTFDCTVPGHADGGMQGTLIVHPAA